MKAISTIQTIAICAFSCIMCVCCNVNRCDNVPINDMSNLEEGIFTVIDSYQKKYSRCKSFTIITDFHDEQFDDFSDKYFLIGASYEGIFGNGEDCIKVYPSHYFCENDKVFFIQSSDDFLYNDEHNKLLYDRMAEKIDSSSITHPSDKSPIIQYLKKAVLFKMDLDTKTITVLSERPDTLLLRKMTDFIPPQYDF